MDENVPMRKEIKKSLIVWPMLASATLSAASWIQIHTPKIDAEMTAWWKDSAPTIQHDWEPVVLANPAEISFPAANSEIASTERFAALFATERPDSTAEITYEETKGVIAAKKTTLVPGHQCQIIASDASKLAHAREAEMAGQEATSLQSDPLAIQSVIDEIRGTPMFDLTGQESTHVTLNSMNAMDQPIIGMRWLARMRNRSVTATLDHSLAGANQLDGINEPVPAQTSLIPKSVQVMAKPAVKSDLTSPRHQETSARIDRVTAHSPTTWPQTPSLIAKLDALSETSANNATLDPPLDTRTITDLSAWIIDIESTLEQLQRLDHLSDPQAGHLIDSMEALADSGLRIANDLVSRDAQVLTRRIAHAVKRRVAVWAPIHDVSRAPVSSQLADDLSGNHLTTASDRTHAIDYADLLRKIERKESDPIDLVGVELAIALETLLASENPNANRVAGAIDTYYRNANVRTAVSQSLLNRLLPKIEPKSVPVRARILGSKVRGVSQINSDLEVRLTPSATDWRIDLRTLGQVNTRSVGTQGPVSVRTTGTNRFVAQTPIEVTPNGVRRGSVSVNVNGRTHLRGIQSDYDQFPIIGTIVREFANSKFDSMKPKSNQIAAQQVRDKVSQEISTTLDIRTTEAAEKLDSMVMGPLNRLQLDPQVLDMQTTSERILARYRLAGDSQLAAFTPRPQAPSSSLMSVQVHQSAINNTLERLIPRDELLAIDETVNQAASVFGTEVVLEEALPSDVMVQFTKTRPVTVEIENGKMWITLRIVKLSRGKRLNLTNFIVRAAYRPEVNGLRASLVRDGHLRISGPGMSMRQRLPLRTIFNKVLSPDRPLPLTLPTLVENPAATGLAISQLEMRSGWIGLAISESNAPRIAWSEHQPATTLPSEQL